MNWGSGVISLDRWEGEVNSTRVSLDEKYHPLSQSNYLDLSLLEQNSLRIYGFLCLTCSSSVAEDWWGLDMHISCTNEIQLISAPWTKQRRCPNSHKQFKLSSDGEWIDPWVQLTSFRWTVTKRSSKLRGLFLSYEYFRESAIYLEFQSTHKDAGEDPEGNVKEVVGFVKLVFSYSFFYSIINGEQWFKLNSIKVLCLQKCMFSFLL